MQPAAKVWDVKCRACGAAIGQVVDVRFIHEAACALPRRIAGGTFRCCHCGGSLYREEARVRESVTPARPTQAVRPRR